MGAILPPTHQRREVLPEREIWDCIGNQRIKDRAYIEHLMGAICDAAAAILKGEPREQHVGRVEKLAAMSKDRRHQKLMKAVLFALREGDEAGVDAANWTAVFIENVTTEPPWYDPAGIDDPSYPKRAVWRPKRGHDRAAPFAAQG